MNLLLISLEQALILLPLVLGMYLSFKILKVTDLTVDGTYVLGAVIFAKTCHFGVLLALLCTIAAGIVVGIIISYMQRHDLVSDLIVGILASFMLYSVNLQILGRPNFSLLGKPNMLNLLGKAADSWLLILMVVAILLAIIFVFILNSQLGLYLKAFGSNQKLLTTLGKRSEKYRSFGLALSNSLACFSGSLAAQINGFADINMGVGVALTSIGAIIIGTQIFRQLKNFGNVGNLLSCFLGILIYFLLLNLFLKIGIEPTNLKLVLGGSLFLLLKKYSAKIRL